MLRSLNLNLLEQEVAKEFASARKKALLRQIWAFLRRNPGSNRLLSFEEARVALGQWRQSYFLGRKAVPVGSIVGSEGRYADFDDEFLPLKGSSEERWRSVYVALRRDGNHRVSVARWLGFEALDAEVVEMRAVVPVEAAISARRKEALPTCETRRPAAPKIASKTAGRYRRSMRRVLPNDSGKRRPTRTMAVAS